MSSTVSTGPSAKVAEAYAKLNRGLIETMKRPGICDDLAMQKTIREIGRRYVDMLMVQQEKIDREAAAQPHFDQKSLGKPEYIARARRNHYLKDESKARLMMHLARHTEESIATLVTNHADSLQAYMRNDLSHTTKKNWDPEKNSDPHKAARVIVGHVIQAVTRHAMADENGITQVFVPYSSTSEDLLAELMKSQRELLKNLPSHKDGAPSR